MDDMIYLNLTMITKPKLVYVFTFDCRQLPLFSFPLSYLCRIELIWLHPENESFHFTTHTHATFILIWISNIAARIDGESIRSRHEKWHRKRIKT